MAAAEAPLVIVIFGVAFGCSIRLASGEGTVIIRSRKKMMIVAIKIIIDVVFGIEIVVVVVVVNCEGPTLSCLTLSPVVRMIIVGVIDEAKGSIIV